MLNGGRKYPVCTVVVYDKFYDAGFAGAGGNLRAGEMKAFLHGDRVMLTTFLGLSAPVERVPEYENYWQLIGWKGRVVRVNRVPGMAAHERGERVLVDFGENIRSLPLACHNEIENALWCFISDLSHCE